MAMGLRRRLLLWASRFDSYCIFYGRNVRRIFLMFIQNLTQNRMYDRGREPPAVAAEFGLRYRLETLIGVTGYRKAHLRSSWGQIILAPINIVWRPQLLGILIFEGLMFGFGIGINVGIIFSIIPSLAYES
jgi:hypothetical protein